jgi:hypothetical protein
MFTKVLSRFRMKEENEDESVEEYEQFVEEFLNEKEEESLEEEDLATKSKRKITPLSDESNILSQPKKIKPYSFLEDENVLENFSSIQKNKNLKYNLLMKEESEINDDSHSFEHYFSKQVKKTEVPKTSVKIPTLPLEKNVQPHENSRIFNQLPSPMLTDSNFGLRTGLPFTRPYDLWREEHIRSIPRSKSSPFMKKDEERSMGLLRCLYDCPVCKKLQLTELELCDHVSRRHNLEEAVCPICEKNFGDTTLKNIQRHLQTEHPKRRYMSSITRRPELITRSGTPNFITFQRLGLPNGHKFDLSDSLWEFIVNLDIQHEKSDLLCNLCIQPFQPHQTRAILTCDHTYHADCLESPDCPMCNPNKVAIKKGRKKKNKKES